MSMALGLHLLPVLLGLAGALPGALATQEVWQSPRYAITPKGGSINITCSSVQPLYGVYLMQNCESNLLKVIFYADGKEPTVDERFWGRIAFSGSQYNLTITMQHLQPEDTNTYICKFIKDEVAWGSYTFVTVTDALFQEANTCQEAQLTHTHIALTVALAVGFLLIGLGLGTVCVLRRMQIKKLCCAKEKRSSPSVCVVYEDMSCRRHNTMSNSNEYQ